MTRLNLVNVFQSISRNCYVQCSVCLVCIHVIGLHVLCSVLCCWFVLLFCLLLFSFSYFTDVHTWFQSSNHHTCSRSPINHSPLISPVFVSKCSCFWVELWQSSDCFCLVLLGFCWFIDLSLVITHLLNYIT